MNFDEPAYLPDGFVKTEERSNYFSYFCEYRDDENRIIKYVQSVDQKGNIEINSEVDMMSKVYINDIEAICNKTDNNISIYFKDEYVYSIYGNIDENELIKIAESIKIKK